MANATATKKGASPDPAMQLAPPRPLSGPWETPGSDISSLDPTPEIPIFGAAAASADKPPDVTTSPNPAQPISSVPTPAPQMPQYKPSLLTKMASFAEKAAPIAGAVGNALGASMGTPEEKQIAEQNMTMGLQRPKIQAETEATQAETELRRKQAEMMGQMATIALPGGGVMQVPMSQIGKFGPAIINSESRENVAKIAHRFIPVSGVGLYDAQSQAMIPGTAQGVTITPEIAQDHNLPKEYIGKPMRLSDLSGLMRSEDMEKLPVRGANDTFLLNRRSGATTPLGIGTSSENPIARGRFAFEQAKEGDKIWEPAVASSERLQIMRQNYVDGLRGDQQAMLSLLANHLGMTMGLQKGAKMNQAIIEEAQKSRPWLEGMQAHYDKRGVLTGVVLSPEQMQQMVGLGEDRYRADVYSARSRVQAMGLDYEPQLAVDPDSMNPTGANIPSRPVARPKQGGGPASPVPAPIANAVNSQNVLSPADQQAATKVLYHGQKAYQKGQLVYGQDGKYLGQAGQ